MVLQEREISRASEAHGGGSQQSFPYQPVDALDGSTPILGVIDNRGQKRKEKYKDRTALEARLHNEQCVSLS